MTKTQMVSKTRSATKLRGPVPWSEMVSAQEIKLFHGPNLWSTRPVLRLTVTLKILVSPPETDLRSAINRIDVKLRELSDGNRRFSIHTTLQEPEGEISSIGDLIGQTAICLQRCLGDQAQFAISWFSGNTGDVEIAFEYSQADVATASATLALRLVSHALFATESDLDLPGEFERTVAARHTSRTCRPPFHTVLSAAKRRNIPVRSIDPALEILELGTGARCQRIWSHSSSLTSSHGVKLAKNKHLAALALSAVGLPVPLGFPVKNAAEAIAAAAKIGYPVVLKPVTGSKGKSVFVGIRDESELREIFQLFGPMRHYGQLLIEQFIAGDEHRILVVNDKVIAINRRTPAHVTGDGRSTIRELIVVLNSERRAAKLAGFPLLQVGLTNLVNATLRQQQLDLDSVPESGRVVKLNSISNISAGGLTAEVTDVTHPDNAEVARIAAKTIGLDIAGIDLVCPDISASIWEAGGAIVEINSNPGFTDHLTPVSGTPRDVGAAVIDMLYPPGQPVRAPIVAVTRTHQMPAICTSIANLLTFAGESVGMATSDGIVVNGMYMHGVDPTNPAGPSTLLNNPAVETAVIEVDPTDFVNQGLGFDYCDLAVIASLSGHVTPHSQPVEIVICRLVDSPGAIVLNADDSRVTELASATSGEILYFSQEITNPTVEQHVRAGGRAVVGRDSASGSKLTVWATRGATDVRIELDKPNNSNDGTLLESALTTAVALALNVPVEVVQDWLTSTATG